MERLVTKAAKVQQDLLAPRGQEVLREHTDQRVHVEQRGMSALQYVTCSDVHIVGVV